MTYIAHIAVLVSIYSIVTIGTNITVGYGGSVSLAQAALFGVGAYASALAELKLGAPFALSALLGALCAATLALATAFLALRLSDDYFVIATLGVQYLVWNLLNNLTEITNGPFGLVGIPNASFFGISAASPEQFLVLALAVLAMCFLFSSALVRSPWGRVLQAIREDDLYANSLGKNVLYFRATAFMAAGALAGLAGSLFAAYSNFIDPTSFTISESVFILAAVIIGGAGSLWGPIAGAVILIGLPELLRFVGLPQAESANLRQIFFGFALVLVLMYRPKGVMGRYAFGRH